MSSAVRIRVTTGIPARRAASPLPPTTDSRKPHVVRVRANQTAIAAITAMITPMWICVPAITGSLAASLSSTLVDCPSAFGSFHGPRIRKSIVYSAT